MSAGSLSKKTKRRLVLGLILFVLLVIGAALLYAEAFGPVEPNAQTAQFLVQPKESVDQIADDLARQGYVRSSWIFRLAFLRETDGHAIRAGGYELSKSMDAWTLAAALVAPPYSAWVTVPVGLRKEQIADILADALNWTPAEKEEWIATDTAKSANYIEGVYFPDTYLIPSDTPPAAVAELMRDRFQVAFAPYANEALEKKIPWPTVLTIASLIQREAGSASDMPLISGIIQKRLKMGMPLAIDATLQYMEGSEDNGWWPQPRSAAAYPNSPFNTYKHAGLPPHPIADPGLTAIEAALNPVATDCLFYIHDLDGQMHCSPTYTGQLANIQKYLK